MAAGADGRLSASARGYDSRWQKASRAFLGEHPLCECDECRRLNRCLPAEVVDHHEPHRLGDALKSKDPDRIAKARKLFWDKSNWRALNKRCHDSWKQRLEKSGIVLGCDSGGIPLDPNHHWHQPG